ncbi:hypothetical protein MDIS_02175 [Mesomycoplasma dispar]|nr:hypothetical protein MDIS_02175 [Mesomycoplasma dispar]
MRPELVRFQTPKDSELKQKTEKLSEQKPTEKSEKIIVPVLPKIPEKPVGSFSQTLSGHSFKVQVGEDGLKQSRQIRLTNLNKIKI